MEIKALAGLESNTTFKGAKMKLKHAVSLKHMLILLNLYEWQPFLE